MLKKNNFHLLLIILTYILFSCNEKPKTREDFIQEIVDVFTEGTDSTIYRIYSDGINSYYSKPIDNKNYVIDQVINRMNRTWVTTEFFYNYDLDVYYEDSMFNLLRISNKFTIEGKEGNNMNYGHNFDFEDNVYSFKLPNSDNTKFMYYFDSVGNFINQLGTPLIIKFQNNEEKELRILFSTFFHTIDSVLISTANQKRKKYITSPNVDFVKVEEVKLDISKDSTFYVEFYTTRLDGKLKVMYKDTVIIYP